MFVKIQCIKLNDCGKNCRNSISAFMVICLHSCSYGYKRYGCRKAKLSNFRGTILCTPPPFCWGAQGGGGVEPPTKFLKRGAWQDLNFKRTILKGGSSRKTNIEGDFVKTGAWTVCRVRGWFGRKKGEVFLRGSWYPNAHYGKVLLFSMRQGMLWPIILKDQP